SADRRISSCPSTAPLRPTDEASATTSEAIHRSCDVGAPGEWVRWIEDVARTFAISQRSEEHTSELQSLTNLVCRLLLDKKNYILRGHSPQGDYETTATTESDEYG